MGIERSEECSEILGAMAVMQSELLPAKLDCENTFHKSKYASLYSHIQAAKDALANNGLMVSQHPEVILIGDVIPTIQRKKTKYEDSEKTVLLQAGRVDLITEVSHKSGQWFRSTISAGLENANSSQIVGSAITYLRRYSYSAILGTIAQGEDDDGNASSGLQHPQNNGFNQPRQQNFQQQNQGGFYPPLPPQQQPQNIQPQQNIPPQQQNLPPQVQNDALPEITNPIKDEPPKGSGNKKSASSMLPALPPERKTGRAINEEYQTNANLISRDEIVEMVQALNDNNIIMEKFIVWLDKELGCAWYDIGAEDVVLVKGIITGNKDQINRYAVGADVGAQVVGGRINEVYQHRHGLLSCFQISFVETFLTQNKISPEDWKIWLNMYSQKQNLEISSLINIPRAWYDDIEAQISANGPGMFAGLAETKARFDKEAKAAAIIDKANKKQSDEAKSRKAKA